MVKKLIKGKDYDGWVLIYPHQSVSDVVHKFHVNRDGVLANLNKWTKRDIYKHGGRLVRVKLVEVTK